MTNSYCVMLKNPDIGVIGVAYRNKAIIIWGTVGFVITRINLSY